MIQIFLHTTDGLTLQTIDEAITVAELAEALGVDDAAGWLEDADEPLASTTVAATAVGENGHLHLTRCRRIEVTINYAGKTKTHEFAPGSTLGRVRRWAVGENGFDLPQKERPKHELGLCGSGIIADRNEHIGTLATDCELCVDLAPKDRFQG
ncbi:hypothetical protein [Pseudolysinimonas sp.]|uniref:hypothetical protein n=1 Tax=Pseudolysinimonas sp. TaxID=2680009 RepID=UPI002869F64E|nr:hypothetical protein [Pseudolysinimonas sp.]